MQGIATHQERRQPRASTGRRRLRSIRQPSHLVDPMLRIVAEAIIGPPLNDNPLPPGMSFWTRQVGKQVEIRADGFIMLKGANDGEAT